MRLRPNQLTSHLQHSRFAPIYFICGDEPLQKLECIDQIRMVAQSKGYDERNIFNIDKDFDWRSINQITNNLSLFSNRRIIELRMESPKPGKEGSLVLLEYANQPDENNLWIISTNKMDRATQNTKWLKTIEKKGILIQTWPISPDQLPYWIQSRLQSQQKQITLDAARLIAQRVEGNLLAAKQEIDRLVLLVDRGGIDVEDIITTVTDSARYDIFDIIESAFLGDPDRILLMLNGLKNASIEPLALFGGFMWEFRRVCSMAYQLESGMSLNNVFNAFRVRDQKKRSLTVILKKHRLNTLYQLLCYCGTIDKTLKSARKDNAWDQFSILLLAIAGVNIYKLQKTYNQES